ncbi:hypothetical protein, partial [Enterocloster bolteae]|uniref:hypothetical protein n=1 Tax=Enterocloster bolteae TaxID=208479 RepID=UPI001A9BF376
GIWNAKESGFWGILAETDGTGNESFLFRRRRRNSPKNPEVKGIRVEIFVRKYYPSLDFWIAWYVLRGRRQSVPEVALRVGACGANKKTRPAKCQIDKAGGFSYNGFSGSDCRPYHEYMRVKLTYSP